MIHPPDSVKLLLQKYYVSIMIASQPHSRSISSSPSTSGSATATLRSQSLMNPFELHSPTHISAQVDCAESWLHKCDNRIHPLLKMHSTLTDVARKASVSQSNQTTIVCTWNGEIIHGHMGEGRISMLPLEPPQKMSVTCLGSVLR